MDVKIESMIFGWDERIPEVLVKFINSVTLTKTLTKDEQELRELVKVFAQSKEFNRFFAFGYGSSHFWLKQRMASDPDKCMENRLLIVEF